ncbi:MAG: hypothetical protein AAGA15_04150 [Pseudomonadota bacterium]
MFFKGVMGWICGTDGERSSKVKALLLARISGYARVTEGSVVTDKTDKADKTETAEARPFPPPGCRYATGEEVEEQLENSREQVQPILDYLKDK